MDISRRPPPWIRSPDLTVPTVLERYPHPLSLQNPRPYAEEAYNLVQIPPTPANRPRTLPIPQPGTSQILRPSCTTWTISPLRGQGPPCCLVLSHRSAAHRPILSVPAVLPATLCLLPGHQAQLATSSRWTLTFPILRSFAALSIPLSPIPPKILMKTIDAPMQWRMVSFQEGLSRSARTIKSYDLGRCFLPPRRRYRT